MGAFVRSWLRFLLGAAVTTSLIVTQAATAHAQRRGGARSSRSSYSRSYRAPRSSSSRSVHVRSYQRRSGVTVRPHYRATTGTGVHRASARPRSLSRSPQVYVPRASRRAYAPRSTRPPSVATGRLRDSRGRIRRSAEARRQFMHSTGYPRGRPGYVVDHIVPLACGGADAPSNMQWQTVAAAKAKDKTERVGCRGGRRR